MHQWSTTPLNNQTADSRANWQEGQPASSLNNSARGLMATAAFWRDDNLGTLVATLGANNTYSVSTGQGLIDPASTSGGGTAKISHAFSLRVVLPAMNTLVATTAPTIIIDGAAAVPLKRQDGSALADGDLKGGVYEILGDTITSGAYSRARILDLLPSDIAALVPAASAPPGCCRLIYTSASVLTLAPVNGNRVQVNGTTRTVPLVTDPSPITLSNAGLTAGTLYYVYLPPTGTALEASTTGHVTGADGTEVKSGDATRAFVGMAYMDAGTPGTFADTPAKRYVASWFNRRRRPVVGPNVSANVGAAVNEVNSSGRAYFLSWAGSAAHIALQGYNAPTNFSQFQYYFLADGTQVGYPIYIVQGSNSGNYEDNMSTSMWADLSEGLHWTNIAAYYLNTNGNVYYAMQGATDV